MSLLQRINSDLLAARKEAALFHSDTLKLKASLLTTLYSEAANTGLNDGKRESTDAEVIATIKKFIKNIEECITHASEKGLDVTKFRNELSVLDWYLPKQLSRDELLAIIIAFDDKNKGSIMKSLKTEYAGQYDGKLAAEVVDEFLKSA